MPILPLNGIRVVDLTHHVAGPYCTKLFADMGADVVKIERPGRGDPARWLYPFAGGEPHPEKSLTFLYLNTNKHSVVLDLKSADGLDRLLTLVRGADVLVESFRPGTMARLGLDYARLERLNPRLVMTSISNFGQDGPYRDFEATEVTLSALSGMMYMTGQTDREPVKLALSQLQYTAGVAAAAATLAALRQRRLSGQGQHVDVSILEPMLNNIHQQSSRYSYWGSIAGRESPDGFPLFAEAKEGWVHLPLLWLDQLMDFMQIPELDAPRFRDPVERRQHFAEMRDILLHWVRDRDRMELFQGGQMHGIPLAPVHTEGELLECPQLVERDYFVEVDHPVAGRALYPGRYFVSDQIERGPLSPAPLLGQHTEEVLGVPRRMAPAPAPADHLGAQSAPLSGVRILTTEHWATLPHASKYLASLGAEVIVVEPSVRPSHDPRERATGPGGGLFNEGGRNKRFVTLNLTSPGGVDLFKRLAGICDVVADNFSPRVMANYGLGYEGLRKVKPDIIVLSMSGWGHRGPWYLYRSYACANEAACGLVHLSGFADGPPVRPGGTPFGDVIPALHAVWSVQVALEHRARTGEGAFIDMGMMEPCVSQLGEAVLNHSYTGESLGRMGNRDLNACPSGCYPCRGEDRWIAIATSTEEQWQALVRAMGSPAWAASGEFSTIGSRREHLDELDRRIGEWTASRDNMETMHLLQRAGVPAGAVLNVREVMTNEHVKYRRAYEVVQHPLPPEGAGNRLHLGPPWKLSRTPAETTNPAPTRLGRDNDYVYGELLGLRPEEMAALDADGTISTETVGPPRQIYRDPGAFPPGDADFLKVLGLE